MKISAKAAQDIKDLHRLRGLLVEHGHLSFYEKTAEPELGIDLIVKFIEQHKYRLIDLFFKFDKDRSGEVTCKEFKHGLKETNLEMSDVRLSLCVCTGLSVCLSLCLSVCLPVSLSV